MKFRNTFVILILSVWANSIWSDTTTTATTVADTVYNSFVVTNPFEGQNNLYEQIFDTMNADYQQIGALEAKKILDNKWTITGGVNSVGFSYHRPFVDFGIALDRNLAPDLFSNTRWIVTDTLTITIDAAKVINKLKNQNSIDINEKNLAAFAGLVFQRKFTWQHFANSYDEGLSTHFEKLFFPFLGVKLGSIKTMESDEIITKEDSIAVNAGGYASVPVYTGVTAMAGALAKYTKLSKMEMTRQSQVDGSEDKLMLSYEKSSSAMAGVSIGVQADFLKVLRMTLLSYDFSYTMDKSDTVYTQFPMSVVNELTDANPVTAEIQNILKTKSPDLDVIAPYIISEEKKIAETIAHKYNFLLLGGSKSAKTQQIDITSKGVTKTFFRHYYEKIKYTEDALSRLISSFIFRIFNTDLKAANLVQDTKKVTIEYDSTKNLLDAKEDLTITDEQTLSLQFEGNYMTKKTTGVFGKKYKERAKFLLDRYSGVDPQAIQWIDSDTLVAPYEIDGFYEVHLNGLRHLNAMSVNDIFDNIEGLCDEKPKTTFISFRSLFGICKLQVQNDYISYLKDLSHDKVTDSAISACERKSWKYIFSASKRRAYLKNCINDLTRHDGGAWVDIPLWTLKNFSQSLVNNIDSRIYYYNLFGLDNVFFHGTFTAQTSSGADFVTYFHEGNFKGLGVVDAYMREENLRSPASIISE